MKLCLNMIVKNESKRIERALRSVVPFIDCYAITDTGSSDGTPDLIKAFFKQHEVSGIVNHVPFYNWSQARNAALIAARGMQSYFKWDWLLLTDADMELVVRDLPKFEELLSKFDDGSVLMEQQCGSLHYDNTRLVSARAKGLYRGVTHEYMDVPCVGRIGPEIAYFNDNADGANRSGKVERDIALLLDGLKEEPNNGRYMYYLAQSYKEKGDYEEAIKWFKKRVDFGGWEEERWSAQLQLAHCYKGTNEAEFIRNALLAYNMRPHRAEALFDLAYHFRLKDDQQPIAALFAQVGMTIPRTGDGLFVNDYVYQGGLKEEFAITGFYNEHTRGLAFQTCSELSLRPGPYENIRHGARQNIYHYIRPITEYCPSFQWKNIQFDPPADWAAMNPSIANHGADDHLFCIVRCVNYRMDEEGRYLIRATDGTANNSNPINTRSFLLNMGMDPMLPPGNTQEILAPAMPCEFPPVIGWEDMRLFSYNDALHASATVRQIAADGVPEQCVGRIIDPPDGGPAHIVDWKRMLRETRECEKNWAPVTPWYGPHPLFMWRPGTTINDDGAFVHNNPPGLTTDVLSGGSQVIKVGDLWLSLIHTAHQIPGKSNRYYYHRWAVYEPDTFKLMMLSRPFVFHDRVIEFAAGLARHPVRKDTLVISYGFKDCEARVATVSTAEVMRMIWTPYR